MKSCLKQKPLMMHTGAEAKISAEEKVVKQIVLMWCHETGPRPEPRLDTRPSFSPITQKVLHVLPNDQNNKNGLIEPAEIIEATMYVRNKGQQVAKNVNIAVLYGDFVFNTGKSSFELGDIEQNQKKKVQFSFFAMSEAQKELPISFEVKESRSKFDQIIPSGLDLSRNNKNQN